MTTWLRLRAAFVLVVGACAVAYGLYWLGWAVVERRNHAGTAAWAVVGAFMFVATGVLVVRAARQGFRRIRRGESMSLLLDRDDLWLPAVGVAGIALGLVEGFVFGSGRGGFFVTLGVLDLLVWTPRLLNEHVRDLGRDHASDCQD